MAEYGIDVEQLSEGKSEPFYEEMQCVLKNNPTTHTLSVNLKEQLAASESFAANNIKYDIVIACRIEGRETL